MDPFPGSYFSVRELSQDMRVQCCELVMSIKWDRRSFMRGKSALAEFREVRVCSVSCQTSAFHGVESRDPGSTQERE